MCWADSRICSYVSGTNFGVPVEPEVDRTIPDRFGARNSRMGKALLETHQDRITKEEFRRVVLWLDSNSLRLGAFYDEEKQERGEVVWPKLDVDPKNPLGGASHPQR